MQRHLRRHARILDPLRRATTLRAARQEPQPVDPASHPLAAALAQGARSTAWWIPTLVGLLAWSFAWPAAACSLHGNAPAPAVQPPPGVASGEELSGAAAPPPLSAGASYRARRLRFGTTSSGRASLREDVLLLHAAYFPWRRLGAGLALPLARRHILLPNGATQSLQGVGDLSADVRWRPRTGHRDVLQLELNAGLMLPITPLAQREGSYYHPDVQVGGGVVAPRVSASLYHPLGRGWWWVAGADAMWAPESPDGIQRGALLRVQPGVDWRLTSLGSLGLTLAWRHESRTRREGTTLAASGGTLVALHPVLRLHGAEAFVLEAGASVPILQGLRGGQRERATLQGGVTAHW